MNEATYPVMAELSYDLDASSIYDHLFGTKATRDSAHQENFQCLTNIVTDINYLVDDFIDDIEEILNIRIEAAQQSVPGSRERRAVGVATGVALTLSLANLGTQAIGALYFKSRYEHLFNYISGVNKQLENDFLYSQKLDGNIRILVNQTKKVGIRSNMMLLSLERIRKESACDLATTWKQFEMSSISSHLNLVANDLALGSASPRIFPAKMVSQLEGANFFEGTMLQNDPLLFYQETKLSILNFHRSKRSISVLLAFPRVRKQPSFVKINFLSPPTLIPGEPESQEKHIEILNELALPFDLVNSPDFDLKNLTEKVLAEARIPSECGSLSSIRFCRNFLPMDNRERQCIGELSQQTKGLPSCQIRSNKVSKRNFIGLKRGVQGSAVSAPDDTQVIGVSGTLRAILHHARDDPKLGFCCYLPAHFNQIEITRKDFEFKFSQSPQLLVHSPLRLKDRTWNYVDKQLYERILKGENLGQNEGLDLYDSNWDVQEAVRNTVKIQLEEHLENHLGETDFQKASNVFSYLWIIPFATVIFIIWKGRRAIGKKLQILKGLGQEGGPNSRESEKEEEAELTSVKILDPMGEKESIV